MTTTTTPMTMTMWSGQCFVLYRVVQKNGTPVLILR